MKRTNGAVLDPSAEDYEERLLNQLLEVLGTLPREHLAQLAQRTFAHEQAVADRGPMTPEAIDEWFKSEIGVEIPKVAVCPGHTAPFDIICKIVLWKVSWLLWIASRGFGKTSIMSWCHSLQAEHWPGYQGLTVGASLTQGKRMYEHLLPRVVESGVIGGKELDHVARSTESETTWLNMSKLEIGPSTLAFVNGPRVPRLHRDEVEIMYREKPDVYKQAANIPAGKATRDGRYMPAQIIDTSTMKWAHGLVAQAKEEYEESLRDGVEPACEVVISCLFECAEEVANCRQAPKEEREQRLMELEQDPCELCDCDKVVRGTWDDEDHTPRTLEQVCRGRFFRSRGFKPHSDVKTLFRVNDRRTWEAEQECSRPSGEGLYVESFSRTRHGLSGWDPDPSLGPIYQAVDWGGSEAHAVFWAQRLDHPFQASAYVGGQVTIPARSFVVFAEIFRGGIGNVALGKLAIAKENVWRAEWPGWSVKERYPDSANAAGILDWKDHLGLAMTSRIKKDYDEEVRYICDLFDDMMIYVVVDECIMFVKSFEAWHEENGHECKDWSTHMPAAARYFAHNINVVDRRGGGGSGTTMSGSDPKTPKDWQGNREVMGVGGAEDSPVRRSRGRLDAEGWRSRMGTMPDSR